VYRMGLKGFLLRDKDTMSSCNSCATSRLITLCALRVVGWAPSRDLVGFFVLCVCEMIGQER